MEMNVALQQPTLECHVANIVQNRKKTYVG